jgi:hypothetical protein
MSSVSSLATAGKRNSTAGRTARAGEDIETGAASVLRP